MLQVVSRENPVINVKDIVVPPANVTDEAILKRIKGGDSNAYGSIMRRYNQRMFRIARSIVVDDSAAMDIVQEAHIKAYYRVEEYLGPSSFAAWLASITRNEALMYLRKHKKEVLMPEDEIQSLAQTEAQSKPINRMNLPEATLENKQLQVLINKQIDKLPPDFRSVFVLRAVEQFSVKETAEILGVREETVKTRYLRAKRLLRNHIQAFLDVAGLKIYEFGGYHCDIIVENVLSRISQGKN